VKKISIIIACFLKSSLAYTEAPIKSTMRINIPDADDIL
jgi:hypothetical protein